MQTKKFEYNGTFLFLECGRGREKIVHNLMKNIELSRFNLHICICTRDKLKWILRFSRGTTLISLKLHVRQRHLYNLYPAGSVQNNTYECHKKIISVRRRII